MAWLFVLVPMVLQRFGWTGEVASEFERVARNLSQLIAAQIGTCVALAAVGALLKWESFGELLRRGMRATWPLWCIMLIHQSVPIIDSLVQMPSHDSVLIALDTALFFGHNPVKALDGFVWMPFTYYMWIVYLSWFPAFTALLYGLALQDRRREWSEAMLGMILTFFLGFSGYILYPAVGPVYTLTFSNGLWGGAAAELMHSLVAGFGGFRDAFPSLHAAVTTMILIYGWRYYRRWFPGIAVLCVSILISTVYLRWHYVVDVIAGMSVAFFAHWLAGVILRWRERSQMASENAA